MSNKMRATHYKFKNCHGVNVAKKLLINYTPAYTFRKKICTAYRVLML